MTIKFSGCSAPTVAILQKFVKKVFQDKEGSLNKEDNVNMDLTIGIDHDISRVIANLPVDNRNIPSKTSYASYSINSERRGDGTIYHINLYLNDAMLIRMVYDGIIPVDFDK